MKIKVEQKTKSKAVGKVARRLFDTRKFLHKVWDAGAVIDEQAVLTLNLPGIYKSALASGLPKPLIDSLLDESAKPMFKHNKLWEVINNNFKKDLKIPFITGYWTTDAIIGNLVPTRGKQIIAEQLGGTTTAPVTAIALGTGTTAAAAGNTALETEITTNGGSRGAATVTNETTTTTGDTEQWVKTFTITGTLAVTEEGLLDNNTSGGNLLARQVFSAVNVVNGDSLQITHTVQLT